MRHSPRVDCPPDSVAVCACSIAGIGESAHVIVLHPRGTSRTGGLSRGWWTDADDVVALLDALHVPSVSVLAHSAGTRLALATATRYPGRVASLALITPPATWLSGSPSDAATIGAARTEPEVVSALAALGEDTATTDAGFAEQFQRHPRGSKTFRPMRPSASARRLFHPRRSSPATPTCSPAFDRLPTTPQHSEPTSSGSPPAGTTPGSNSPPRSATPSRHGWAATDQSSSSLRLRQRMPAAMRPSRSPSKTTAGLPTS
ncbi:Alpha/beta hydrolase family protein [Microbacterium laevaniformans]|uniref:Alpha/beta hydrolase family protein n=1 Tax=Microbacterium laevaniformans TaxID=36807 RepID=A0A150H6I7_9MICO|nr:Alpha/beta hydrolase family protein [Microbacterium laevaniformans]